MSECGWFSRCGSREGTALQAGVERLVLHPGVAVQWYTQSLPGGPEADRLLHEVLPARTISLYAVSGIEREVFRGIAQFLGDDLDTYIGCYFADDIPSLFRELRLTKILKIVPERPLLRAAFLTTAEYHVPLSETLYTAYRACGRYRLSAARRRFRITGHA